MIKQFENRDYQVAFSHFGKIGPKKLKRLESFFPNLATAFTASLLNLEKAGLEPLLAQKFSYWRQAFDLEAALKELANEKINFITWRENNYPDLLKELPDPPPILYYRGDWEAAIKPKQRRLAIVGSRQPSAYATKIIKELMPTLSAAGIVIVSGLALGVDALAHQATLDNQGKTLAVLGSGLSTVNIYPRANRLLAESIIKAGGLLISEFPPNIPPLKQNFPQRNRIIAGLCQATLVIEAKGKSGALITANHCLEQNREVLAAPGNIFSALSTGPNNLIKMGAKPILNAFDILEVFKLEPIIDLDQLRQRKNKKTRLAPIFKPENEAEEVVYNIIKESNDQGEKITTDEIIKLSKLDTATINSTLSILEIRGTVVSSLLGYEINC